MYPASNPQLKIKNPFPSLFRKINDTFFHTRKHRIKNSKQQKMDN